MTETPRYDWREDPDGRLSDDEIHLSQNEAWVETDDEE